MTTVDDLLARAALLKNPRIPADTVPYVDTCPSPPPQPHPSADDLGDDTAAQHLHSLCEVAVAHATAPQLTDFITDQLPAPRGAWILGCLLHLAGAQDGARYWWQYAAGAGERGASHCLSLHHRAQGDDHAAGFWLDQAGEGTGTREESQASTTIILRIVAQMTAESDRTYSEPTLAVMSYATAAVTDGYRRHPDLEIPAPGPYFAERVQIILAALADPHEDRPGPSPHPLPARPNDDALTARRRETPVSDHVLVQLAAPDAESATDFRETVARTWRRIPSERPQKAGQQGVFMRFLLDVAAPA
ncbi:hypothetical protein JQK87_03540 [Streptomyces sp. G44]|uniref:hypothetical protein n=1 Tax=Streptomyces sp. G44 TaxID=2807632 RepID=UPI00195FDE8B|nr:hypothetical protein [Streptomyces sp. G44]MBM7167502.1 hypothetical protein [Streptomyces sp. G44]